MGQFWAHAITSAPPAGLIALMQSMGVPRGLSPDGESFAGLFARRFFPEAGSFALLPEPPLATLPAGLAGSPLDWTVLPPAEAVLAGLLEANTQTLADTFVVSNQSRTFLEAAFQAGFETLAAHFVLTHPTATPGLDKLSFVAPHVGSRSRLPWFHAQVEASRTALLGVLVTHAGVDINQADALGRTALFYAETPQIVSLLLGHGLDATLHAKDHQDAASFWHTRKIPAQARAAMEALLPGTIDPDWSILQDLSVTMIDAMVAGIFQQAPYQPPALNWGHLATRSFARPFGAQTVVLSALDACALSFLAPREAPVVQILLRARDDYRSGNRSARPSDKFWGDFVPVFSSLVAKASPLPPQTSGFPSALVLRHLVASYTSSGLPEVPVDIHNRDVPGFIPTPTLQAFLDAWETSLGATAGERLVSFVLQSDLWRDVTGNGNAVGRLLVEEEFHRRLRALPPGALPALWNNTNAMLPADHARFWTIALRNDAFSAHLLDVLLVECPGGVPHQGAGIAPLQVADLYAALTHHWILMQAKTWFDHMHTSGVKKATVEQAIKDWTSQGVAWPDNARDRKRAKDKRLATLPQGPALKAVMTLGCM
jgi:hypothetical protein